MGVTFEAPCLSEDQGNDVIRDHLPTGRVWGMRSRFGSAIVAAMAACWGYAKDYADYIRQQTNIDTTSDAIEEWEDSVLLPDGCSLYATTLEQRRWQVKLRLKQAPYVTADEIAIAVKQLSGYDVIIKPRRETGNINNGLFDIARFDSGKFLGVGDLFTFDVFVDWTSTGGGFDEQPFGTLFEGVPSPRIVECLINKLKPCNSVAVFYYSKTIYEEQKGGK